MLRVRTVSCLFLLGACNTWRGTQQQAVKASEGRYDVIIEHGRIVDGTGADWFDGDLAITGDRIVAVTRAGRLRDARATERVDARGHVVAPGFIDIQGQSVYQFTLGDGRVLGKITQGVTTEILGEGDTPAPVSAKALSDLDPTDTLTLALARRYTGPRSFDRWLRDMEAHGMSTNAGSFVGAGTLRQFGMAQAQGPADAAALAAMQEAAAQAMRDGAFGFASALIYPPGNYASTAELIAIAKAVAPSGGVYITHMRGEGDGLLESVDEAIRIGREGGVPVEIYHLKAGGVRNWSKGPRVIAKIDSARAAGLDIQADMYPYQAGGTGLSACLPPWASADGKLFDNLANPAMRAKMRAEMEHQSFPWEPLCDLATPDGVLIAELKSPALKRYGGMRLGAIAKALGKDWIETAMDLIATEHNRVETIFFMMSEENVRLNLRQPWIKIGTDADGLDPDSATGLAHPRSYGTYTRILGRYVRDERVLTLEDAVRKFTSAVATRLAIPDRGVLKPGMRADIVIFDPATVAERATFEKPHQLSVGVRDVWVNGARVLKDGRHTGAKPGRALRGPGYAP
ncbi:MAG: amidohydrolase family protein [Gemmatimonadetes bacterium]|nr:amidohydrolase family protein [Gemmatimonadota bacterium]